MPELPEVETTRRGIEPHVVGQRIVGVGIHDARLRWPVASALPQWLAERRIVRVGRRAKYLALELDDGATLLWHLGMSGSLRVLPATTPRLAHDHVELLLASGYALRYHDPRRFGSLHYTRQDLAHHPLLAQLAPEPLSAEFDGRYLWEVTRARRVAIKNLLLNSQLVVGVGNIYASEALFRARIRPTRRARCLTRAECTVLARAIKAVLRLAIRAGGTTLRDYVGADGSPGYFRRRLYVYERAGQPCRRCGTAIRRILQGQRASYFCPACQPPVPAARLAPPALRA
ncbi:MAG: bifunctional DNA-formamidopyrimidine glycosylase/DNA-(apurinic or apyrimidinic site) lyase [Steroidobacteraceae bacterium]|nr:bifunctional DNA-formamidopyrimidine glycosylase/DNA-(apurinic or apyrimidinic site) lyase [Steroidobacteraceae bacterium]MDW8258350.1 bifunctional DNA-formamidopyrimidine glycosylase/DNA-(apurinic or apyrimidinic site) lyase [Gammaproteobacteria bacterium]